MEPQVLRCAIEDLGAWHPYLYTEPYTAAFVAVTGQYSVSPAEFLVDCEGVKSRWLGKARGFPLEISWTEDTIDKAERLRATMPARSLLELAAVAVALVLVHRVVPLGTLNVMENGGRADHRSARVRRVLEVSGTERLAELARRRREKVARALANPYRWDAYVIVCVFCAEGHRVSLSGHRWEESPYAQT
jgi:hypothetical protein